jgi:predicted GIY-YIG superfamily endonuclease
VHRVYPRKIKWTLTVMAPVQSRRSRKLREATYIDGQQNSVMRELSTPNRDGTIPIMNFLENTTKFMQDTRILHERLAHLEKENADYRRFQGKIIPYLEQIVQVLNKDAEDGPEQEKLPSFDLLDDTEDSQTEVVESIIPNYFEAIPSKSSKRTSTPQYTPETLVHLDDPPLSNEVEEKPSSMNQLSAQGEINALLEEDLRKMEALTKDMRLRPHRGNDSLLKNARKSGKNRSIVLTDPNKKEEVKLKKEYSLKKVSRGSKLRKIYEANIQLNRQMQDEMNELESIRQYLLRDDEEDDDDDNDAIELSLDPSSSSNE